MQKEYRVKLERDARNAYAKLDENVKRRVRKGFEKLKSLPKTRSLRGHPEIFVLGIGQYRILYLIDEKKMEKIIAFIGKHKKYEEEYKKIF